MPIVRIILVAVWAILWCVSLALPVASMGGTESEGYTGLLMLMLGWIGVFGLQFAWLANFTLPGVAVLSLMKTAPVLMRVGAAVLQIGLAISALFWTWLPDEGGVHSIERYGLGYYLWLGVMAGSAVALLVMTRLDAPARKSARKAEAERDATAAS